MYRFRMPRGHLALQPLQITQVTQDKSWLISRNLRSRELSERNNTMFPTASTPQTVGEHRFAGASTVVLAMSLTTRSAPRTLPEFTFAPNVWPSTMERISVRKRRRHHQHPNKAKVGEKARAVRNRASSTERLLLCPPLGTQKRDTAFSLRHK